MAGESSSVSAAEALGTGEGKAADKGGQGQRLQLSDRCKARLSQYTLRPESEGTETVAALATAFAGGLLGPK